MSEENISYESLIETESINESIENNKFQSGFIKINYDLLFENFFLRNSRFLAVYVYILFKANYKDKEAEFNGVKTKFKTGSFIGSIKQMTDKFGDVRQALYRLQEEKLIEYQPKKCYTKFTIVNFNEIYNLKNYYMLPREFLKYELMKKHKYFRVFLYLLFKAKVTGKERGSISIEILDELEANEKIKTDALKYLSENNFIEVKDSIIYIKDFDVYKGKPLEVTDETITEIKNNLTEREKRALDKIKDSNYYNDYYDDIYIFLFRALIISTNETDKNNIIYIIHYKVDLIRDWINHYESMNYKKITFREFYNELTYLLKKPLVMDFLIKDSISGKKKSLIN
jgi:hypothetical protein